MVKLKVVFNRKNFRYTQLKRCEHKAFYIVENLLIPDSEKHYEVFKIKVSKSGERFGKWFDDTEQYPNDKAFGSTSWCFRDFERACGKYNDIKETGNGL